MLISWLGIKLKNPLVYIGPPSTQVVFRVFYNFCAHNSFTANCELFLFYNHNFSSTLQYCMCHDNFGFPFIVINTNHH